MIKIEKQNKIGILGAILLHLLAFNIFMVVKINEVNYIEKPQITIDIQDMENPKPKEYDIDAIINKKVYISEDIDYTNYAAKLEKLKETEEKLYPGLQNEQPVSEEYKQELLKEILGESDYNKYLNKENKLSLEDNIVLKEVVKNDSIQKPLPKTIIKGPSTLVYDLKNRFGVYMYIPVYTCKNGGSVSIDIVVNRSGNVTEASLNRQVSVGIDECIAEEALKAAQVSKFNYDSNAPENQQGSIAYTFLPQ